MGILREESVFKPFLSLALEVVSAAKLTIRYKRLGWRQG